MFIKDFYKKDLVLSLEIFPPKPTDAVDTIYDTLEGLADLRPDFISVTYGAGGSSQNHTTQIADIIKNKYSIEPLAHLTCCTHSKTNIDYILNEMNQKNIQNILALRGDLPSDFNTTTNSDFTYAKDLIEHIKNFSDFSVGCACYPEGHIECNNKIEDLKYLKEKTSSGTDFMITQLFFDNSIFYDFQEKLDIIGIDTPISAGIMPVINKKQIERIASMCGVELTPKFKRIVEKYEYKPNALREAGMAYATEQIIDLISSGVDGIHLYTMNRPEVARKIIGDISNIRQAIAI